MSKGYFHIDKQSKDHHLGFWAVKLKRALALPWIWKPLLLSGGTLRLAVSEDVCTEGERLAPGVTAPGVPDVDRRFPPGVPGDERDGWAGDKRDPLTTGCLVVWSGTSSKRLGEMGDFWLGLFGNIQEVFMQLDVNPYQEKYVTKI